MAGQHLQYRIRTAQEFQVLCAVCASDNSPFHDPKEAERGTISIGTSGRPQLSVQGREMRIQACLTTRCGIETVSQHLVNISYNSQCNTRARNLHRLELPMSPRPACGAFFHLLSPSFTCWAMYCSASLTVWNCALDAEDMRLYGCHICLYRAAGHR